MFVVPLVIDHSHKRDFGCVVLVLAGCRSML
jgi:hypothetical protein